MDVEAIRDAPSLCYDILTPTIFHETWWLSAATGDAYEEVTLSADGRVVARFPFVIRRMPTGHALACIPELTHFLGPAIDPGEGSATNRRLKEDGILRDLLARMPRCSGFYQKLHRDIDNTLVFQELGYHTAVQFTYEIHPAPAATIWAAMRDKTRNAIRRAESQYCVAEISNTAQFASFYVANLDRRGKANHYPRIIPVCDAALQRDRGRIIAALDASGKAVASIFYCWDARTSYYLLSTRGDDATNGAVSLLIWHAIQDAAARGLTFDFDGVAAPGSRIFYTGFGGRVAPRYIVSRYTLGHRVVSYLSHPFYRHERYTYQR